VTAPAGDRRLPFVMAEPTEPTFDERLGRLEAIVAELEDDGLGLERAIDRYQEGIALLKQCHGLLSGYRAQVEELTREAEDGIAPYDGDPDVSSETSSDT